MFHDETLWLSSQYLVHLYFKFLFSSLDFDMLNFVTLGQSQFVARRDDFLSLQNKKGCCEWLLEGVYPNFFLHMAYDASIEVKL